MCIIVVVVHIIQRSYEQLKNKVNCVQKYICFWIYYPEFITF